MEAIFNRGRLRGARVNKLYYRISKLSASAVDQVRYVGKFTRTLSVIRIIATSIPLKRGYATQQDERDKKTLLAKLAELLRRTRRFVQICNGEFV